MRTSGPRLQPAPSSADSIDLLEIGRTLRRGWRHVAAFTAVGLLGALAVIAFAPRRFDGSATVVLKSAADLGGAILSRVGMAGGSSPGAGMAVPDLGGMGSLVSASRSPMETEMQVLTSRAVAEEVIDSLRLSVRVREPAGRPAIALVRDVRLAPSFKRRRITFERTSDRGPYEARSGDWSSVATPGGVLRTPVGSLALRGDTALPRRFTLELLDREDAAFWFSKRLVVSKAGGEVARVTFRADDSLTAARVPNTVLGVYLVRRKTVDRGVNQHRAEFLQVQSDSVAQELVRAERELRRYQERTGVIEPMLVGKLQLERAGEMRSVLSQLQIEEGAITHMLSQVGSGSLHPRQIAAYPEFLKSQGINEMLKQMSELETKRSELLERRTDQDPEVLALTQAIDNLEGRLQPMAVAYAASVGKRRVDVSRQLDTMYSALGVLPGAVESSNRLQRDVLRLGTIYAGLQGQLVSARLAAIGEGGDVRELDEALPPKKPGFPRPVLTMGLGAAAGLASGLVAALLVGLLGRWAADPREVERAAGVPALRFDPREPLVVSAPGQGRTLLLIPLDTAADTAAVAERLARTATARSTPVSVLDLTGRALPVGGDVASESSVADAIARLEAEFGLVVVRLPGLHEDVTSAALDGGRAVLFVAPAGPVDRTRLQGAVETLRRLSVPCAGVVMQEARRSPRWEVRRSALASS